MIHIRSTNFIITFTSLLVFEKQENMIVQSIGIAPSFCRREAFYIFELCSLSEVGRSESEEKSTFCRIVKMITKK